MCRRGCFFTVCLTYLISTSESHQENTNDCYAEATEEDSERAQWVYSLAHKDAVTIGVVRIVITGANRANRVALVQPFLSFFLVVIFGDHLLGVIRFLPALHLVVDIEAVWVVAFQLGGGDLTLSFGVASRSP